LQISVELADARDKTHMWGEQYNRKAADLQAIQEEITRTISDQLRLHLTATQSQQLTKRATQNPQAYELYLQARYLYHRGTIESYTKAIEYFKQAISLDPNYALAYAGLADCYSVIDDK